MVYHLASQTVVADDRPRHCVEAWTTAPLHTAWGCAGGYLLNYYLPKESVCESRCHCAKILGERRGEMPVTNFVGTQAEACPVRYSHALQDRAMPFKVEFSTLHLVS